MIGRTSLCMQCMHVSGVTCMCKVFTKATFTACCLLQCRTLLLFHAQAL